MKGCDKVRVLSHVSQRRHARVARLEPRAAEAALLRHMDGFDRRGGQAFPGADPLEDQAAGVGKGDRPEGRSLFLGKKIKDRNTQAAIPQRERQRAAYGTCAANQYVDLPSPAAGPPALRTP